MPKQTTKKTQSAIASKPETPAEKPPAESLRERVEAAKETEQALMRELAEIPGRMREAAAECAEGFQKAAESGQKPSEGAALSEIRRRGEELPTLVWPASLSRIGLQIEYHELRAEESQRDQYRASEKAGELEKKRAELLEEIEDFREEMFFQNAQNRDHRDRIRWLREERAALNRKGPDYGQAKRVGGGGG